MDKTLVITGGSSGIGLATAMLFAQKGWRVFELSRHGESHDGIVHIDCDVVEPESVRGAIAKVLAQISTIDVLISNAASVYPARWSLPPWRMPSVRWM